MGELLRAIPRRERLIVALDVPTAAEARKLVERLGGSVSWYKIGLELAAAGGYYALADWLVKRGHQVFADLKLYDIPETVRRAVANLRGRGIGFLTVHGNRAIMEAAAKEKGEMKILAVTVLTSLDERDLEEMGYRGEVGQLVPQLVLRRAGGALAAGCDGVIASGLEASGIKSKYGEKFLVVAPGIRAAGGDRGDQKRSVDVAQAFRNGADYIVVGRPVRDAKDPAAAAEAIQATVASIFES